MKKLISVFLAMLLLTGCTAKKYTPIIETSFSYDAKYIMGDFSFNCTVEKNESVLKLTVNDTKAKGLIIICDGQNLEFVKGEFSHSISIDRINNTNPCLLLFNVFHYLESSDNLECNKVENGFRYVGNTPLGSFELYQNEQNEFYLINVPNMNIRIELSKND